jgi:hypothetical protein
MTCPPVAAAAIIKWWNSSTVIYELFLLEMKRKKVPTYISTSSYIYQFQAMYWASYELHI